MYIFLRFFLDYINFVGAREWQTDKLSSEWKNSDKFRSEKRISNGIYDGKYTCAHLRAFFYGQPHLMSWLHMHESCHDSISFYLLTSHKIVLCPNPSFQSNFIFLVIFFFQFPFLVEFILAVSGILAAPDFGVLHHRILLVFIYPLCSVWFPRKCGENGRWIKIFNRRFLFSVYGPGRDYKIDGFLLLCFCARIRIFHSALLS